MTQPLAPRQVVAREQEALAVQEADAAARVPRDRDGEQVIVQADRIGALQLLLDLGGAGVDVVAVEHAPRAEVARELRVVRDVVLVAQQEQVDSAQLLQALHERAGEARRVDEHVAGLAADQVRGGAEAGLGMEAAVVDALVDGVGQARERGLQVGALARADGRRGAAEQRHEGARALFVGGGLTVDPALPGGTVERPGRHPAAGIAVDAGGVDVEVALDIRGQTLREGCHDTGSRSETTIRSGRG